MERPFMYHVNTRRLRPGTGAPLNLLNAEETSRVRRFHQGFSRYAPTPLVSLPHLAAGMGLGGLRVKDESRRFGLNAFKVLGASYAMGRYLAARLGKNVDDLTPQELCSPAVSERLGPITFVSATDGNHGRAVAWTAQQLGKKAVIYMPKGSDPARLANIRSHGAEASITDLNYDDAVRLAWKMAQENGWVMVQDTAWDGYEDIPLWIIQGYASLAVEALAQWFAEEVEAPTHLFLQAGVGSFASGVLGCMASALGDCLPATVIVEPHAADCIYQSACAGEPRVVTGDLSTLMAGLACGEPCTVGWPILRDYATAYLSCPDFVAANGMRLYAAPRGGDEAIVSGESGAATLGALEYVMRRPELAPLRDALGLGPDSRVMLISTEGDTSPEVWREVCWRGGHGEPVTP